MSANISVRAAEINVAEFEDRLDGVRSGAVRRTFASCSVICRYSLQSAGRFMQLSVPNGEICLHQFLPMLAHIIPPHLLHAGRFQALPRN
jgi:hypothetical protein